MPEGAAHVVRARYELTEAGFSASPQRRIQCACVSWSSARECIAQRYRVPVSDETCECPCHRMYGEDDE